MECEVEKLRNNKEFLSLCKSLKACGIVKSKEGYIELMMNITKDYFTKKHNMLEKNK